MFDSIVLFYVAVPSWSDTHTLCTVVDRERFYVFSVDLWVQKSGHLCY